MSATFTWSVVSLPCYAQIDGQSDVVFQVVWNCDAVQGEYKASAGNGTNIPYVAGSAFTPFNQLTQDQALSWVWSNGVDKLKIEAALQAQIDAQITPPIVKPQLPWDAPAA